MKNLKHLFLTFGIIFILIGALGISNISFFSKYIEYIISGVLFVNGIYHLVYCLHKRKDPYFHIGLVLLEGLMELISVGIILFNTFSSEFFFTSYIGALLCAKGLILVLGRDSKFTSWEDTDKKTKVIVIVKGLLHFLFGSLIIILPLVTNGAVYPVFGWYILFLGIHIISNKKF
ncbi:DUF308 domain-containing protein [uncultured Cetobacterium sp.]|uniref:DUF308 domain-containing protein n=1 Tax=uncultured Cetobacterium sp. TaxID=527638 RepID=UPI00262836E3|nr:DUF308 domain-containing protein [uncultured Cetobacterium sp.]